MALRKNQPNTQWMVAQRRQPSSVSNVGPTFIAVSTWGGSSCEKTTCTKTAYCISNDMLTQLALLTVVNNELGKPNAWVLTNLCTAVQDCIDQEFIQDLIWDTIQWFDYNDALNQWLLENPFPIPYTLTSTGNTITLTIAWNPAQTATLVLSNSLTNAWLVITSSVNWVVSNTDITSAVQALIDSNTDSVTNTVTGHRIATHTAVDNTAVDINETITTFTPSANGYTHTNEAWVASAVVYDVIDTSTPNPKLTITVDGTLVKTIDLNQNDIQINNAGSDFDLTDDSLSFVETNGDTATISFAKYNVTVTTQPNWDQLIYQNGNLLATVYKNAADINYDNTTSGLTATNVQDAIDELQSALAATTDLLVDNWDWTYTHTEVDGWVVTIDTRKSVLGDATGSVTTEITTDTPIVISTDPTQVGVLTDGTEIILPSFIYEKEIPLQQDPYINKDFIANMVSDWTGSWRQLFHVDDTITLTLPSLPTAPAWMKYVFVWEANMALAFTKLNWTVEAWLNVTWCMNTERTPVSVLADWSYFLARTIPVRFDAVSWAMTIDLIYYVSCEVWTPLTIVWWNIFYYCDWIRWYLKLVSI